MLLRHAYPLELQSDGYLLTLQQLGVLRLFLLPRSLASQCHDALQREGAWHTHTITTATASAVVNVLTSPSRQSAGNNAKGLVYLVLLCILVACITVSFLEPH